MPFECVVCIEDYVNIYRKAINDTQPSTYDYWLGVYSSVELANSYSKVDGKFKSRDQMMTCYL